MNRYWTYFRGDNPATGELVFYGDHRVLLEPGLSDDEIVQAYHAAEAKEKADFERYCQLAKAKQQIELSLRDMFGFRDGFFGMRELQRFIETHSIPIDYWAAKIVDENQDVDQLLQEIEP